MIASVKSAAYVGIGAYGVSIEVDVADGLPQFIVVGLPDVSIKESRERVRAAIKNSGYRFPPEKITVNLAPADIRKEGPAFDLPIALGILAASGTLEPSAYLESAIFLGELALDGSLRPVNGSIVMAAAFSQDCTLVLPEEDAKQAALVSKAGIRGAKNLAEVVGWLNHESSLNPVTPEPSLLQKPEPSNLYPVDFAEVRGQRFAKRAIEIAVAGGHNLLFIGPPGSGKTMLAQRIPTILSSPDQKTALEITKIHSIAGQQNNPGKLVWQRPFRAPHHTISSVALAGGGSWPKPGEVSLAHEGVLFLDEFPEFRRDVLEALRGPLEDKNITLSRARTQITYPANFLLVAAMNPCPCGYLSDSKRACRCSLSQIQKYQSKISGPILDRIDLHVEVASLPVHMLAGESAEESSADIRKRIMDCQAIQRSRAGMLNAGMRAREIRRHAALGADARKLMEMAMKELRLSARAYYKILKVARTIADMASVGAIHESPLHPDHIAEAIQYRSLDRHF